MTQKFVVRLMTKDDQLLSWAEVHAEARPQPGRASCPFFAPGPTLFVIDAEGVAFKYTVHWCDLDIARERLLLTPTLVPVGAQMRFDWTEPVWLTAGSQHIVLPAVTLRGPVLVGPPTGNLTGASPQ